MKALEKQQNNVKELLRFIKENPDLEILPMVDSQIGGDDYSYYMGEWGTVEIGEYYCTKDRICFKKDDFEELVEKWTDDNYEKYPKAPDELLEERAIAEIDNLKWTKAIVVYVNSI